MRHFFPVCLIVVMVLSSGCAFSSKEIRLNKIQSGEKQTGRLKGIPFQVVAKDARDGDAGCVGATPWSLADVTTKDDVSGWVGQSLTGELKSEGAKESKKAGSAVRCNIKTLYASFGFWSTIDTILAIDVTVLRKGKEKPLGLLEARHSPGAWFISPESYENAITECLKLWLEKHSPKIIAALEIKKKKPEAGEPTTIPEEKTTIPRPPPAPPKLQITSHKTGQAVPRPEIRIKGRADNAADGNLQLLLNGEKTKTIYVREKTFIFDVPVALKPGKNNVKLVLKPRRGREIVREVNLRFMPPPIDNLHALITGVEKFSDKGLSGPEGSTNLAMGVYRIISSSISPEITDRARLLHQSVTVSEFLAKLKHVLTAVGVEDSVVIFYSGAVIEIKGELALALSATDPKKPGTAVLLSDIELDVGAYFKGKSALLVTCGPGKPKVITKKRAISQKKLSHLHFIPVENRTLESALSGKADADQNGYVSLGEIRTYLGSRNATFLGSLDDKFILSRVKLGSY